MRNFSGILLTYRHMSLRFLARVIHSSRYYSLVHKSANHSKNPLRVILFFLIYPAYYLFPIAMTDSNAQMGQSYFGTFKATDIAGSILNAWVLKSMDFPWSYQNVTNWPDGEFFWRWQNFTQFFQLIYTWLAVKIFHPSIVVASIVFIGWVFTAYVIYLLCRELGIAQNLSIIAAIFWQILPVTRSKAVTETSFMFIGLLVLYILILVKKDTESQKKFKQIFVLHFFVVFTDAYLFFMLLLLDVCFIFAWLFRKYCFDTRKIRPHLSRKFVVSRRLNFQKLFFLGSIFVMSYIFTSWILQKILSQNTSGYSRPVIITPRNEIIGWLGSPLDYLNPIQGSPLRFLFDIQKHSPMGLEFAPNLINYSGVFLSMLGFIGLLAMLKDFNPGTVKGTIPIVFAIFFLTSTYISIRIPTTDILIGPLSVILANVMPGVRIFTRFGLLSTALLCVAAAYALSKNPGRKLPSAIIPLIAFLIVIDLNPLAGRGLAEETNKFALFNKQIVLGPSESLLQLPLNGRAWADHAFLFKDSPQFRTVNSLYSDSQSLKINTAIERGKEPFIKVLKNLGVKYIIIVAGSPKPYDQSRIEEYLSDSRFVLKSNTVLSGSESDYSANLVLYSFIG